MATFPGKPPNPLGAKVELLLAGVWTDVTAYAMVRDNAQITGMGRPDESNGIQSAQLTLTLKNTDGRFTPKNAAGAYYPNIVRNCQVRVSVNAQSAPSLGTADGTFETGVAAWVPTSATFAQSSTQAHSGAKSGLLTVTGTPAQAYVRPALTSSAPVTPTALYTAGGWLYSVAGYSNCAMAIDWYTSAGVYLSTSSGPTAALAAGAWQFYSVTNATAPATAAWGEYGPTIGGSPPAGTAVFLDDAAMAPAGNVYSGSRFTGEISSWPPASNVSGRDLYVSVTASGIWRRISQSSTPIGSPYTRYLNQLTGTSVPATAWAMEDGNNSTVFVTGVGAGAAAAIAGTPSFAADGTSFAGSDALPQFNGARITANVSSAASPVNTVVRFALSVPAAGDSAGATFAGGAEVCKIFSPSATVKRYDVSLAGNQLQIHGYTSTAGGSAVLSGTVTTKVNGTPVLVSVEITPSGGSINWAIKIIKPGAGAVLDQVTGTRATSAIAAVTQVSLNGQGRLADTAAGQLGVFYAVPSLTTAAAALGGFAGEFAVDRFNRVCGEFGIATTVIGSTSAAMGPQADDTLAAILQSIEDTDGGLLYETRDQFGLGYRTLISLQNQGSPVILNYAGGVLGDSTAPLVPVYDDALLCNSWTVTNTDGYVAQATLTSGAISVQPAPNGVGVYGKPASTNASAHAQVNAIAQQKLFQGTVDEVRYPVVTVNLARAQAAPLFASVPGLRIGDYLQVTNVPATMGGTATSKQLAWGYSEVIGPLSWVITFNTVPEVPFETGFSPGVFSVTQAPGGAVAAGSAVGSSVSGSQLPPGSVGGSALASTISARSVGGVTSFISAATPYDWSFAVSGVPADITYFTCTEDQALPISAGDTFTNSGGLGGPFTVTSLDPPSGGNVNIHFTPDASGVMSAGTVFGGKNGDTWVNISGGNQVNQWAAGAWVPITWTASSVLTASSITAGLIAAGTIIAGIVDGTTIMGATIIADGTSGEILVYSGSPAAGNLIGSWSGASGTDGFTNAFAQGLEVHSGGLVLDNQGSAPSAVSGASSFYSSTAGRPRYLNSAGADAVIERSEVNVAQFSIGANTTFTAIGPALNYKAGEGAQSSEYEIEASGQGTVYSAGSPGMDIALFLDGVNISQQTVGGSWFTGVGLGNGFGFRVVYRMSLLGSGAGATAITTSDGTMWWLQNRGGGGASGVVTLGGQTGSTAFDTTANHTLEVRAKWSGTATGAAFTAYRSKPARRM